MDQKRWVYFGVYCFSDQEKEIRVVRFRLVSDISLLELEMQVGTEVVDGREMGDEGDLRCGDLFFFTRPRVGTIYSRKIFLSREGDDIYYEENPKFLATVRNSTYWAQDLKRLLRERE